MGRIFTKLKVNTKGLKIAVKREECGSPKGYRMHKFRKEMACIPCTSAHSEYQAQSRVRSGFTKTLSIPVEVLYQAIRVEINNPNTKGPHPLVDHLGPEMVHALYRRFKPETP